MLTVTNNSSRKIARFDAKVGKETLEAVGAITLVAGTLLGRATDATDGFTAGNLREYNSANGDGSVEPVAVLLEEVVFTGAGTAKIAPIVSGEVNEDMIGVHNGTATPDAIDRVEYDQLRNVGILSVPLNKQITQLDNQ